MQLLRQIGLSHDSSLLHRKPSLSSSSDAAIGKFGRYGSLDQLQVSVCSNPSITRSTSVDHERCHSSSILVLCNEIRSINSFSSPVGDTVPTAIASDAKKKRKMKKMTKVVDNFI
ncbi:hypothetical protein L1987_17477 [Smallanthus sonchifolius]|uniref:Uncharacterized protein n=1 Tax=Smallanthus sonchifolius TaxID=185202 RepID=A0ACB9IZJ5_9ASTR|nr:hypothetical protein L1987_17477 [Smallanthus sonchifolius]